MFVVVGSSLQVYPAAGLVHAVRPACVVHLVDPGDVPLPTSQVQHRKEKASLGVPKLASELIAQRLSSR